MFVGECITTSRNNLFSVSYNKSNCIGNYNFYPSFLLNISIDTLIEIFLPKVGLLILLEIVVLCLISIPKNIHTSSTSTTLLACNCDMSWVLASLLLPQFSAFSFLWHFVAYTEFDLSYFDTQVTFLSLILFTLLILRIILPFLLWQFFFLALILNFTFLTLTLNFTFLALTLNFNPVKLTLLIFYPSNVDTQLYPS